MFFDRTGGNGAVTATKARHRLHRFPGPVKGLVRSKNPALQESDGCAEILRNYIPTLKGARARRGSEKHATVTGTVEHLTVYDAAVKKLFAGTGVSIVDVTAPADPNVAVAPAVSGLTGGDWSSVQFGAAGGSYLVMVNGVDDMRQFDGTSWLTINAATLPAPRAITGVLTNTISYVWAHQKRLWMIQKGTMSAWYLTTVAAVGGAVAEFPLGSVFKHGGELVFGATWSVDVGDGQNDLNVFVTSNGEVAVYRGINPASDFSLVNVYRIGKPLHKNAHFRGGGDLGILAEDGIIPLSLVLKFDRAAIASRATTAAIDELWTKLVEFDGVGIGRFSCALWPEKSMLYVGTPTPDGTDDTSLVSNAKSGAWGQLTGWPTRCCAVFDGKLYIGGVDAVTEVDTGGSDNGMPYQCVYLPCFTQFKSVAEKSAIHARARFKSDSSYPVRLFANANFTIEIPPLETYSATSLGALWDDAEWDVDHWEAEEIIMGEWQAVAAFGDFLSAGATVSVSQAPGLDEPATPHIEIYSVELVYEEGQVMA